MKTSSGITLVELLGTLIIGAFMLLTIGIMIIYSYVYWQKASQTTDFQSDVLAAKTTLGYSFRNATTDLTGAQFAHNYRLRILHGGRSLYFPWFDPSRNTYMYSCVRQDGNELLFDYWIAEVDPVSHQIRFATHAAPAGTVRLMDNVQDMRIRMMDPPCSHNSSEISFDISQQKVTNQSTGSALHRRTTFNVKSRNR